MITRKGDGDADPSTRLGRGRLPNLIEYHVDLHLHSNPSCTGFFSLRDLANTSVALHCSLHPILLHFMQLTPSPELD